MYLQLYGYIEYRSVRFPCYSFLSLFLVSQQERKVKYTSEVLLQLLQVLQVLQLLQLLQVLQLLQLLQVLQRVY